MNVCNEVMTIQTYIKALNVGIATTFALVIGKTFSLNSLFVSSRELCAIYFARERFLGIGFCTQSPCPCTRDM